MKQDPLFALSKAWQTISYAIMAVGLFLLFFLGARAFTQIADASQVRGRPRQQAEVPGLGLASSLPASFLDSRGTTILSTASPTTTGDSDDSKKRDNSPSDAKKDTLTQTTKDNPSSPTLKGQGRTER